MNSPPLLPTVIGAALVGVILATVFADSAGQLALVLATIAAIAALLLYRRPRGAFDISYLVQEGERLAAALKPPQEPTGIGDLVAARNGGNEVPAEEIGDGDVRQEKKKEKEKDDARKRGGGSGTGEELINPAEVVSCGHVGVIERELDEVLTLRRGTWYQHMNALEYLARFVVERAAEHLKCEDRCPYRFLISEISTKKFDQIRPAWTRRWRVQLKFKVEVCCLSYPAEWEVVDRNGNVAVHSGTNLCGVRIDNEDITSRNVLNDLNPRKSVERWVIDDLKRQHPFRINWHRQRHVCHADCSRKVEVWAAGPVTFREYSGPITPGGNWMMTWLEGKQTLHFRFACLADGERLRPKPQ